MNVLWITNKIFPEACEFLGIEIPVEGGWMYGLAQHIASVPDITLAVATVYNGKEYKIIKTERVIYYLLPSVSSAMYEKKLELFWKKVCAEFNPDLVHIHGTEFTYGLACMRGCPSLNYIISIQGLVGEISKYYYADMSIRDIIRNITFRDIVRFDTIINAKTYFEKRGVFEKEYLLNTKHVIGRTSWDYIHVKAIHPEVTYHFCNETLRSGFYESDKWNLSTKTDYTIFLSQAVYPIKGLHQVLKAAEKIKAVYPNVKIRIAGSKIATNKRFIDKVKLSGYGSYITNLIYKLNLVDSVRFLGILTEEQMIAEYKNAHVFVCPSSIENSPNSLGEAQIIGVPCVASFVGGIPDMVKQNDTGLLYRFEDIEMLSEMIKTIFSDDNIASRLSMNGINAAEKRHDRNINYGRTVDIYQKLIK